MATVKIYIRKRPTKEGKYPISIRITNNRKQDYILTGQTLDDLNQWDEKTQRVKKSHPNATRLNNYLLNELAKINDKALELETKGIDVSAKSIKLQVKPVEVKPIYFIEIAQRYLKEQWQCGNYDVYKADISRLKRFYEFSNNGIIPFAEINVELLRRYTVFLRTEFNRGGNDETPPKPLSERTIVNHLLIIRTMWNRAITAKVVTDEHYPFGGDGKIAIKFPKSQKVGLNKEEIIRLEKVDLSKKPMLNHARNICLTSYYFAWMRLTDTLLLKWPDFQNGRLFYKMSKNEEPGSVKIADKAMAIIEQYRNDSPAHDLVFPDLKRLQNMDDRLELRRIIALAENRINKAIKKIMVLIACNKNASPHKFRHSFAQTADEMNVSPKVLQKLYRHESIITTMNYQSNFSHQKADDALDAVLGL